MAPQKTVRCNQDGWNLDILIKQVDIDATFGVATNAELEKAQSVKPQFETDKKQRSGRDKTANKSPKNNSMIAKFIACYDDKNCHDIQYYSTARLVNLFRYDGKCHYTVKRGTTFGSLGGYYVALVDYTESQSTQEAISEMLVNRGKHRQGIDTALLDGLRSRNSKIRYWSFVTCDKIPKVKASSQFALAAINLIGDKKLSERAMRLCGSNPHALGNRQLPGNLIRVMKSRQFSPHTRVIAINIYGRVISRNYKKPSYSKMLKKRVTPVLKLLTKDPSAKVRTAASSMLINTIKDTTEIAKRDKRNNRKNWRDPRTNGKSGPVAIPSR